ncbi:MAG: alpha/beta hydrolase [Ilumatobacter sp.]|nr:alpha/beta hydrolase [Ilumatobacter sp.]
MAISFRARLMRRLLGRLIQDEKVPLPQRRIAMDRAGKLPKPRRVDYTETTVGGVAAIVATPTAVEPDRHILYLHGGGYILGSPQSHIRLGARLAKYAGAVVTLIEYRLAPEHVYPAAIDDCVAAYRDLASRVDPALITIAGDSAGGGAALATMCVLRDAGDPLPACAYLLSPWTDLTGSGESVTANDEIDPMINGKLITATAEMYAGDRPLDDPGISPLFADLTGLPPLLIQTGTDEVLLSDSERLAERAAAAGVEHELDLQDGMWHVYQAFVGFMPEANAALVRAARFIRAQSPALVDA